MWIVALNLYNIIRGISRGWTARNNAFLLSERNIDGGEGAGGWDGGDLFTKLAGRPTFRR